MGPREPEVATPSPAPGGVLAKVLAIVAPVLLLAGLLYPEGGIALTRVPLWSLYAIACCVVVFVGVMGGRGSRAGRLDLGLVGAGGLAAFWVLLVLPGIASNAGFLLTAATVTAGLAAWLSRDRAT